MKSIEGLLILYQNLMKIGIYGFEGIVYKA